jgi:hypothetical protein
MEQKIILLLLVIGYLLYMCNKKCRKDDVPITGDKTKSWQLSDIYTLSQIIQNDNILIYYADLIQVFIMKNYTWKDVQQMDLMTFFLKCINGIADSLGGIRDYSTTSAKIIVNLYGPVVAGKISGLYSPLELFIGIRSGDPQIKSTIDRFIKEMVIKPITIVEA